MEKPEVSITLDVDVARSGKNTTILRLRHTIDHYFHMKAEDLTGTVEEINNWIESFSPAVVTINSVGIGAGVADALKKLHGDMIRVI